MKTVHGRSFRRGIAWAFSGRLPSKWLCGCFAWSNRRAFGQPRRPNRRVGCPSTCVDGSHSNFPTFINHHHHLWTFCPSPLLLLTLYHMHMVNSCSFPDSAALPAGELSDDLIIDFAKEAIHPNPLLCDWRGCHAQLNSWKALQEVRYLPYCSLMYIRAS